MITVGEIISKPILNLYTGKIEGTIHNVVFSKDYKKIQQIKIFDTDEEEYLISTSKIYSIGNSSIVIKNNDTTKYLFENLINNMEKLSEDILFPSNQCMLSLMLQAYNINYDYIKNPEEYFNRYEHNSNIKRSIT